MILIKGGRVIDPISNKDEVLDVVIDKTKIKYIGKFQESEDYEQIIHAKGLVVAPGLVDVHVHFRDPGFPEKEDIISGAKAAAKGGFTSVVMLANTKPVIDCEDVLDEVITKCKQACIHVYPNASITKAMKGKELTDFKQLKKKGAVGFSDDGKPLLDANLVYEAMKLAKELNVPLSLHEEDPAFVSTAGIHEGEIAKGLGLKGASSLGEDVMVARDVMIAKASQAHINIQHISSKNAIECIRLAKKMGAKISCEATPHHFSLTQAAVLKYGTLAKMNPPLRTSEDQYAIVSALKDGTIDIIASDHAPHTDAEKALPFEQAPSGIIGLETSLSLGITNLVRKGILTLSDYLAKMTCNPSSLYQLDAGCLKEGGPADLVIFDERAQVTYDHFISKSNNSPFLNETLYGKVMMSISDGKIVYVDEELK
ncbi:MAG: dihydroorotase [Erysipelotrichaceae bacterium]